MEVDYSKWPQVTMTKKQWEKASPDYTNVREDGTKTVLYLDKKLGTTLAVVTIKG